MHFLGGLVLISPLVLPPPLLCWSSVQRMHFPPRFVAHLSLSLSLCPSLLIFLILSTPTSVALFSRERGRVAGSQRQTAHPSITPAGSLRCWALSSATQLLPSIKTCRWAGMQARVRLSQTHLGRPVHISVPIYTYLQCTQWGKPISACTHEWINWSTHTHRKRPESASKGSSVAFILFPLQIQRKTNACFPYSLSYRFCCFDVSVVSLLLSILTASADTCHGEFKKSYICISILTLVAWIYYLSKSLVHAEDSTVSTTTLPPPALIRHRAALYELVCAESMICDCHRGEL